MDRVYTMQLVQSYQAGRMTRRTFTRKLGVALGSVAATNMLLAACAPITPAPPEVIAEPTAGPVEGVSSGTIPPLPPNLIPETIRYGELNGQELTGYLVRPSDEEPRPAIIVIQEWWGLDDHIRDVANRIADQGYVVLAPDLYHGVSTTEPDEARKLLMELDMEAAVEEISIGLAYLLDQEYASGERGGIVGFCVGGRLALQTGISDDNLGAVVAFYGTPLTEAEAPLATAPILGHYGALDTGIPAADINAMGDALTAARIPNEMNIYADAMHSFFNDTRASYNPEAAAAAWARTLEWFEEHLG